MRLLAVGVLAGLAGLVEAQSVRQEVAAAEALGARTGVCVLDSTGGVVFSHRATEAVAPASNQKLLTAIAVLRGLGTSHRFVTRFVLRRGGLVVHASGDPNWITASAHDPMACFGEVAAVLQRRGVRSLRDIELAPGVFTGPMRPATWPQNQLHTYYCAPTGPFVLDQGVFALRIDPRGQTRTAVVALAGPVLGPRLAGSIRLVDRRGVSSCGAIDRGDSILVRGQLSRRSAAVTIRTAVADPTVWYARMLRGVLREAGIGIDRDAPAPADGPVAAIETTIGPAMLRMLEDSSNFDAEQCLRALGAGCRDDGSLAGGLAAMREQLAELIDVVPKNVVFADGSGLARSNRATPAFVAAALHLASRQPFGTMLRQALPVAARTGTLTQRFAGTALEERVQAKTGWIRGASALSGYVETRNGGSLCFAILMSYDRNKGGLNKHLKRAQERIVAALVRQEGG